MNVDVVGTGGTQYSIHTLARSPSADHHPINQLAHCALPLTHSQATLAPFTLSLCTQRTFIIIISTVRPPLPPRCVYVVISSPTSPALPHVPSLLPYFRVGISAQTDRRTESLISSVCCLISGSLGSALDRISWSRAHIIVPSCVSPSVSPLSLLSFLLSSSQTFVRPSVRPFCVWDDL